MKRIRLLLLFPICCLVLSCKSVKQKHIRNYVNDRPEYKTLNIQLDNNLTAYYVKAHQSTNNDGFKSDFTVFNFINTNCGSCYETMDRWTDYLLKQNSSVHVVFIATGEINEYFNNYFNSKKDIGFDLYLDKQNIFSEKNGLIIYKKETFLVDRDGNVVLYGDPTKIPIVADYYNYILNEN